MNLGAKKVTDSGDYFAWGETAPYYVGTGGWPAPLTWNSGKESGYAWQSYCGSSSFSEWSTPPYDATTKILKPDYDVAAHILGNGWRMPTKEEFKALNKACLNGSYDKTTNPSGASASVGKGVYWCTSYDGVAGCLFCDGTNKLFFPAAGIGLDTGLEVAGSNGYWSSSLNTGNTEKAYYLSFSSNDVDPQNFFNRYRGFSVRPVKAAAAPLPAGALSGEFSVSATKKVHFSQGNLYAKKDDGGVWKWDFYEKQYKYNSYSKDNTSRTAKDDDNEIDLFTWGYGDWSTNPTTTGCGTDFSDWGSLIDGDSIWCTLSSTEWQYLKDTRNVNGGTGLGYSYQYATINTNATNTTYGMILYPDNYTEQKSGDNAKSYTSEEWIAMENAGCVFLPAGGSRNGPYVNEIGTKGIYWSSTGANYNANCLKFYSDYVGFEQVSMGGGFSVRLVTEVK